MSESAVVRRKPSVRCDPLSDYEKKELTHFLKDFKLAPTTGRLLIHFHGGWVVQVEPQPVLK